MKFLTDENVATSVYKSLLEEGFDSARLEFFHYQFPQQRVLMFRTLRAVKNLASTKSQAFG